MKIHDYMNCQSNICQTDPENYLRTWYPDEEICIASPRERWQKVQAKIHRLYLRGKLKYLETYFFKKDLEKIQRVTKSVIGRNPERKLS